MKKLTKLQRSQNAHMKLRSKHSSTPGKIGDVKYRYHTAVLKAQKAKKHVLSKSDRAKIYKTVCNRVH